CIEEGAAYSDWLLGQAVEGGPLQIMYGIRGERSLPERELPLRGYRDSRPVRIGNAAVDQFQLDIYGSLIDAALRYDRQGGLLTVTEWEKITAIARSEEHTSELQSREKLVCRLLLEKKNEYNLKNHPISLS